MTTAFVVILELQPCLGNLHSEFRVVYACQHPHPYNHTILLFIIFFFVHAFYSISVLTLIIKLTEHFVGKGTEYRMVGHCHYFCRMES